MTNTGTPSHTSEEVARQVGHNIRAILAEQGRNLEWLADEIGINVQSILKQFSERVDLWLVLEAAFYLEVAPDRLIGAGR